MINPIFLVSRANRPAQQGNTLLVVVVLLLLASLFVLFALNVGRFEQRTSGNDLRARLVQEVAEGGISKVAEYFNANRDEITDIGTYWVLCGADETAFPCGAVPAGRRGTMYAYHRAGTTGAAFEHRLVDIDAATGTSGGFATLQQTGAVLCRIKIVTTPGAPTECATTDDEASPTWLLTMVSKGSLPGEGSSSTVTQTIGAYNIFAFNPNMPPVVASGNVSVGGGLQIVTGPDAAGENVPVSVWTRLAMQKNGTPNTCYIDAFLRQGGSSQGPQHYDGIDICHTCMCPGDDALSFPKSGNEACQGRDIVDIDGNSANSAGCTTTPNLDIRREEFPSDLFAFVFGQKSWNDVNRSGIPAGDACTTAALDCHFGEQRRIESCTFPYPGTGAPTTWMLPADTCYLLNIKRKTHIGDGINDDAECAALGSSTKGVVWIHPGAIQGLPGSDCDITNLPQIGTPSAPVALIFDGALTNVHFKLYGLLFVREPNISATLSAQTGGTASLGMNAGAVVYGAVIVQGPVTSGGGGSAAIVYNRDVLTNLLNAPENFNPASLPGSWTDRLRY